MQTFLGLDIGYSGVKFAVGAADRNTPDHGTFPATAEECPRDDQDMGFGASRGTQVLVGDTPWLVGIPPSLFLDHERPLRDDYPRSREYHALLHGALKASGQNLVDTVATGLPVSQYFDKEARQAIMDLIVGEHQVDATTRITVHHAAVYPQPVGSYIAMLQQLGGRTEKMSGRTVLIIDPGFFSVDSLVVRDNHPFPGYSTTSLHAMSRLIGTTDRLIVERFHAGATRMLGSYRDPIEQCLQQGKTSLPVSGQDAPENIVPFLREAASTVARRAIEHIQSSVRSLPRIDVVLVTGGGATWYAPVAKKAFPDSRVTTVEDAPFANAQGFWNLAGARKA